MPTEQPPTARYGVMTVAETRALVNQAIDEIPQVMDEADGPLSRRELRRRLGEKTAEKGGELRSATADLTAIMRLVDTGVLARDEDRRLVLARPEVLEEGS